MLTRVARAARRTELRMRAAAALDAVVSTTAIALVAVAIVLTAHKVAGVSTRALRDVVVGAILAVVLSALWAATRRIPQFAGALALDVHHALSDRLTNALSFASLPPNERTPLME